MELLQRKSPPGLEEDGTEEPLEGGPKIFASPEDTVLSSRLVEELDINPALPKDQQDRIAEVVKRHAEAFGLDDRLGHLNANVQIPLKPGWKEVSLPQWINGFTLELSNFLRVHGLLQLLSCIGMESPGWWSIIAS